MSERPPLATGATGTATLVVGEDDLASRLTLDPRDTFPPVFATTRMIGLMELAAAAAMRGVLGPGELSVGVEVAVRHSAPTPPGARVTATARFTGMSDKLYAFEVVAEDEAGEVGRGVHHRAVITAERLVAGSRKRRPAG